MPERSAANLHGALLVEAMFGERIPECRRCGTLDDMTNLYDRAAVVCNKCGWIEANEQIRLVPKDERLR